MNKYIANRIISFSDTKGAEGFSYSDAIAKYPDRKTGIDAELTARKRQDLIEEQI